VDPVLQRAWVFGSARDLCHQPAALCASHWWGQSSPGNGVRAWWSDDLITWHSTARPALVTPRGYPFNTDVTPVAGKSLVRSGDGRVDVVVDTAEAALRGVPSEPLNFVLVAEHGVVAMHAGADRNLTRGWTFAADGGDTGGFSACPSVHYSEDDGNFYVIFGGQEIGLSRSRDLTHWEHAGSPLVTYDHAADVALSPFLGIREQAAGTNPASAEHATAAAVLRQNLAHPECWEFFVNDADFCCGGPATGGGAPAATAFVWYSPSSQGHGVHKNCTALPGPDMTATDFNGVATANTSLSRLLASRFGAR